MEESHSTYFQLEQSCRQISYICTGKWALKNAVVSFVSVSDNLGIALKEALICSVGIIVFITAIL